ncbi:hypothetical protein CAC42_3905 [Sphaceloma murrayae]|uniref:Uncharacterized protein n=1 Tax=Sphaceloma murrayae TaxID=2082308 RepID=A0A2K1QS79_9PEZI|nr:hypothetical protein CAC42_3905 [Sphaceloma murrayae]
MSADLFAAFGDDEKNTWGRVTSDRHVSGSATSAVTPVAKPALDDDDDVFGDFEETTTWDEELRSAEPPYQVQTSSKQVQTSHNEWQQDGPLNTRPQARTAGTGVADDARDVLFDAEEAPAWGAGDDDEFGDFEEPQPKATPNDQPEAKAQASLPASMDILSLDDQPFSVAKPKPRVLKSTPKPSINTQHKPDAKTSPISSITDTWDDFSTTTPAPTNPLSTHNPSSTTTATSTPEPPSLLPSMLLSAPSPSPLAPSNIPPPSLLLPLFPPILLQISSQLTALPSPLPQSSIPPLRPLLTSLHALLVVQAHVIAGRKLRWRRDKRLAQSMAIGPSVSGRSGGMKLAGVDKGEQGREEVEVREAVGTYRRVLGGVRRVVGAVNAGCGGDGATGKVKSGSEWGVLGEMVEGAGQDSGEQKKEEEEEEEEEQEERNRRKRALLPVPEIGEMMPVRTATRAEGAVTSTAACGLCGLKREERVQKVDLEVMDSFGEWWIEGTNMHTDCWRFWEGFKGKLGQR